MKTRTNYKKIKEALKAIFNGAKQVPFEMKNQFIEEQVLQFFNIGPKVYADFANVDEGTKLIHPILGDAVIVVDKNKKVVKFGNKYFDVSRSSSSAFPFNYPMVIKIDFS